VRHRKARTKLGRSPSHIKAMRSNMLVSLIQHRRIKTTERKARELRGVAEKAVTRFTALGDLLLKDRTKLEPEERARIVHAMRMVRRGLRDREAVLTLYDDIAPRYLGRPGGYTRVLKTGFRRGDAAPMAILEFIEAEMPEREGEPAKKGGDKEKKGLLSRLRRKKK
jgi:large subunit ribosomal protein L17